MTKVAVILDSGRVLSEPYTDLVLYHKLESVVFTMGKYGVWTGSIVGTWAAVQSYVRAMLIRVSQHWEILLSDQQFGESITIYPDQYAKLNETLRWLKKMLHMQHWDSSNDS